MPAPALLARVVYLLAASALLAWSLALSLRSPQVALVEGPGQILVYGMMALSIPTGLVVVYAWGALAAWLEPAGASPLWDLVALWLLLLTAGYLQWFVALPALVRRFRRSG